MATQDSHADTGLGWPIKGSFARYVAGLPDGRADLDGAVVASREWGLVFPLVDREAFTAERRAGLLKFDGGINFHGHFRMLQVTIADLWLAIEGGGSGVISMRAASGQRMNLARFRLRWLGQEAYGEDVRLDPSATGLFGGIYEAETLLDPFIVRLEMP